MVQRAHGFWIGHKTLPAPKLTHSQPYRYKWRTFRSWIWRNTTLDWWKVSRVASFDNLLNQHDDVIKWKHFPHYWPFVRSPVNFPHKGQWHWALMFSLICTWINSWVNIRMAGDWRCHRVHYDVTVMSLFEFMLRRTTDMYVPTYDLAPDYARPLVCMTVTISLQNPDASLRA